MEVTTLDLLYEFTVDKTPYKPVLSHGGTVMIDEGYSGLPAGSKLDVMKPGNPSALL